MFIRALVICCCSLLFSCSQKTKVVALQPFEGFDDKYVQTVTEALDSVYSINAVLLPPIAPYEHAFTNFKAPRYRADTIIATLKRTLPDSIDYVIGLTHLDICITKYAHDGSVKQPNNKYTDFGIFGLGYRPGPSCVVSTFRFGADEAVLKSRLAKVAVHELGHNLGLPHCPDKMCVMTDAVETIKTVDGAQLRLCENCKGKVDFFMTQK